MKNKLKILIIALLLFIPLNVFASDGETENLFINIDILDNGSIKVKELASLEGTYNGRLRNIYYANSNATNFTGATSDFKGSDIYNGSSLNDLLIYDVKGRKSITFNSIFDETLRSNLYREVSNASSGERGIYTLYNNGSGIDLKIFNPSSSDSAFYMEYTVEDVVVVHNDVAELAWNILGNSYEDNIDNMEVHVNLPSSDESLKVWLRGPLNGYIENVDNKYAKITYNFLGARNAVSTRLMFNKDLVPNATKFSGVDGKEKILEVEKIAADKANKDRNRIKIQNTIIKVITLIWFIGFIVVIILFFKKKKESNTTIFNQDYLRDFPETYGPEIVTYLVKGGIVDDSAMSASLLMIIEKKALLVEQDPEKKDNYTLIKNDEKLPLLTEEEVILLSMMVDKIGNGKKVTLNEIKKYGKSLSKAQEFIKSYDNWKAFVKTKGEKEDFFNRNVKIKNIAILLTFIGFIIAGLNLVFDTSTLIFILMLFLCIIMTAVFTSTKFKTKKGAEDYKKWMALKKFMVDFGSMDDKELPEITLWEKYLVYATALGCADKLEKTMKIKMTNMEQNGMNVNANYYMMDSFTDNIYIMSSISHSVNNAVTSAVASSRSSIASSYSSSGSGGGGGASFGGGSFGGGGGGGHF